jgi:hypothetical protein
MSLETAEKAFAEATDPTGSKLHAAILGGVDKNGTLLLSMIVTSILVNTYQARHFTSRHLAVKP